MNVHMQEMLSKEKSQPIEASLNVEPLLQGRKDVAAQSPLSVRLTARGEAGLVHVDGELDIDMEYACSRCLNPVHQHMTVPFHEQFKPASAVRDDEEEDDTLVVEGEKLDLLPYVEEAFLLEVPFILLCRDDCKGLCPQCGSDLNEGDCVCSREVIDPRLAGLKDLFNNKTSE